MTIESSIAGEESGSGGRPVTRLAPSPTGDLHLGNARTFLFNWAMARRLGWRIGLRHEDLDASRVDPGSCARIEDSLVWLGLDWDGPSRLQSDDLDPYLEAMNTLASGGHVFRSDLSRREVREASGAPHGGELVFPATLRPSDRRAWAFEDSSAGHRFAMPGGTEPVHDEILGPVTFDPAEEGGDPVVWTRDGRPAYQLAVVVDDLLDGVTDVIRGDDLLGSAARQQRIRNALGVPTPPRWWHLPLLHDEEGRRLSKRDGDLGLHALRSAGVPARRVVGLCVHLAGLIPHPRPIDAEEVVRLLDPADLPTLSRSEAGNPRCLTREDLEWLKS